MAPCSHTFPLYQIVSLRGSIRSRKGKSQSISTGDLLFGVWFGVTAVFLLSPPSSSSSSSPLQVNPRRIVRSRSSPNNPLTHFEIDPPSSPSRLLLRNESKRETRAGEAVKNALNTRPVRGGCSAGAMKPGPWGGSEPVDARSASVTNLGNVGLVRFASLEEDRGGGELRSSSSCCSSCSCSSEGTARKDTRGPDGF